MKKFLACLIILALFGGFVFFTGWTQIKIKKDSFGIVVSKLHGIDENPVQKGKFTFHKDFLLPSNAQLISFYNKPFFTESSLSGALPSADYYEGNSLYDFSYSFTFAIEAHTEPEDVVSLLKKNLIQDQESLEKYLETSIQAMVQDACAYYLSKASENYAFIPETVTIIELYKNCRFYEKFPEIQIDTFALKSSKLPDYELYRLIRTKTFSNNIQENSSVPADELIISEENIEEESE